MIDRKIGASAYVRVSTDNQDTASQKDKITDYALKNGYEIDSWFVDEAISGAEEERPELIRLKTWVKNNPGSTVIMVGIDRLARDMYIYASYNRLFEDNQIHAIYINIPQTGEPSVDTLLQNILAAFASYEKTVIKERFNRGKRYLLKQNKFSLGGRAPYGYIYTRTADGFICQVVEDEAEVIREIFKLYGEQGYSKNGIVEYLTEKAVKLPNKNYINPVKSQWAITTINHILHNTAYVGTIVYGKTMSIKRDGKSKTVNREISNGYEQIKLSVPSIVSQELFDKVQTRSKSRSSKWGKTSPNKKNYLLKGLLRCTCGYRYTGVSGWGNNSYYRCGSFCHAKVDGKRGCGNVVLKVAKIDELVWKQLENIIFHPETVFKEMKKTQGEVINEVEVLKNKLIEFNKEIKEIEVKRSRIIESFASGLFEEKEVKEYKSKLKHEKEIIDQKITETKEKIINLQNQLDLQKIRGIDSLLKAHTDRIKSWSEDKTPYVNKYIKEIIVYPEYLEVSFALPIDKRNIVTMDKSQEAPS